MSPGRHATRRHHIFLYGSLLDARVLHSLLARPVPMSPARLAGWRRLALRHAAFPGLLRQPGTATDGAVIHISGRERRRLDTYEDDYYQRRTVKAEHADGIVLRVQTYGLQACHRGLTRSHPAWSLPRFSSRHGARSAADAWRFARAYRSACR